MGLTEHVLVKWIVSSKGVHVVLLNNCTILGQHTVLPTKTVVFKMQFGQIVLGNAIRSTEISVKLGSMVIFQIAPLLF